MGWYEARAKEEWREGKRVKRVKERERESRESEGRVQRAKGGYRY